MTATTIDFEAWATENLEVSKKDRDEWTCYCNNPDHNDAHPSMRFNIRTGLYICFSCGWKGKVGSNGRMLLPEYDYEQELMDVKKRLNELMRPSKVREMFGMSDDQLERYNFPASWAQDRGFNLKTIRTFDLGYDVIDNAGTIPVRDMNGILLGVIKRYLDPDHKGDRYKSPFGFKKSTDLFGSWLVNHSDDIDTVAIVEGPTDAMKCWQAGVPAVALHGNMVSPEQVRMLPEIGVTNVVLFGDNDREGWKGNQRLLGRWWDKAGRRYEYRRETDVAKVCSVKVVKWLRSDEKDPGATSLGRIKRLVRNAKPLV